MRKLSIYQPRFINIPANTSELSRSIPPAHKLTKVSTQIPIFVAQFFK